MLTGTSIGLGHAVPWAVGLALGEEMSGPIGVGLLAADYTRVTLEAMDRWYRDHGWHQTFAGDKFTGRRVPEWVGGTGHPPASVFLDWFREQIQGYWDLAKAGPNGTYVHIGKGGWRPSPAPVVSSPWTKRLSADFMAMSRGSERMKTYAYYVAQIDTLGALGGDAHARQQWVVVTANTLARSISKSPERPRMCQPSQEELARGIKAYLLWSAHLTKIDPRRHVKPDTATYLWEAGLLPAKLLRKAKSKPKVKTNPRMAAWLYAERTGHVHHAHVPVPPRLYSEPPSAPPPAPTGSTTANTAYKQPFAHELDPN